MLLKLSAAALGMLLSQLICASETSGNPFLKPSQRGDALGYGQMPASPESCAEYTGTMHPHYSMGSAPAPTNQDIYHPEVLGQWTREQVDAARYVGQLNGHRVYYHEAKASYIRLDLSKARPSQAQ